ncbi:hypothetical protein LCGC14_0946060 [marine sediment metagenome]|uniref:Uncharacterized protein n=1 Tax=marine sediment metagenome TaxID=412755 RepID=A0A0F9NIQ8_9ZZZZ
MKLFNERDSLDRPAWTQADLYAYKHKHHLVAGKYIVEKDYFVKSEGKK